MSYEIEHRRAIRARIRHGVKRNYQCPMRWGPAPGAVSGVPCPVCRVRCRVSVCAPGRVLSPRDVTPHTCLRSSQHVVSHRSGVSFRSSQKIILTNCTHTNDRAHTLKHTSHLREKHAHANYGNHQQRRYGDTSKVERSTDRSPKTRNERERETGRKPT